MVDRSGGDKKKLEHKVTVIVLTDNALLPPNPHTSLCSY